MDASESKPTRETLILDHERQYLQFVLDNICEKVSKTRPLKQGIIDQRLGQLEQILRVASSQQNNAQLDKTEIERLFDGFYSENIDRTYFPQYIENNKMLILVRIAFYIELLRTDGEFNTWQELISVKYPAVDDYYAAFIEEKQILQRLYTLKPSGVPQQYQSFHLAEYVAISEARCQIAEQIYGKKIF